MTVEADASGELSVGHERRDPCLSVVGESGGSREGLTPPLQASGSQAFQHLLFVWLSPSFPVGGYAYSHGLEMAANRGFVKSRIDLQGWISDLVTLGSLRSDLILLAAAYRHVRVRDDRALAEANAMALALQPSSERFLETTQQGRSFLSAVGAGWPVPSLVLAAALFDHEVAYSIAVGVAAAAHGVPLGATLGAYAFSFVTNLTSASIRLGIVGQTDAQAVIAAVSESVLSTVQFAETAGLNEIGSATFSSDLCSLEHETQYSRLFRS